MKRVTVCSGFSALRDMMGTLIFVAKDGTCLVILDGIPNPLAFRQNEIHGII